MILSSPVYTPASRAPRWSAELALVYERAKQKGNRNRSTLAVARKLVAYLMAVDFARRISEYLEMRMPEGLIGKLKMLPKLAEMGAFFPKVVSRGPCQEIVKTAGFSLYDYPVLTCWPDDGGPFITLPMVFSKNPET